MPESRTRQQIIDECTYAAASQPLHEGRRMSWLDELKVGDQVVLSSGYSARRLSAYTVDRLTKTQIVVGTMRFRRTDGRMVGRDTYSSVQLLQSKPELLDRIRRDTLVAGIKRSESLMYRLPLDMLETFAAQLQSVKPPVKM